MAESAISSNDVVEFTPSQMPLALDNHREPVPYTGGPLLLLWSDVRLFFKCAPSIIGIFRPLNLRNPDIRDELYLKDWRNLFCLGIHALLVVTQALFLVSCVSALFIPVFWFACWVAIYMLFNTAVSFLLNGTTNQVVSQVPVKDEDKHAQEYWIFLNGVAVGYSTQLESSSILANWN